MTKNDSEWVLTQEHVTNFKFFPIKNFNMIITDDMFKQLQKIGGKKKVKELMADIVRFCTPAITKVGTDLPEWKFFQNLIPENERKKRGMSKNREKLNHHCLKFTISRSDYYKIRDLHHKVNTFSMALIIRMMFELFIKLYKKCGNVEKTLKKIGNFVRNMTKTKNIIKINFILLKEELKKENLWRAVAFFEFEYRKRSGKMLFSLLLRL